MGNEPSVIVTVAVGGSLHINLARAARQNGRTVEQEMVDRLARTFNRKRENDALDDMLSKVLDPTVKLTG